MTFKRKKTLPLFRDGLYIERKVAKMRFLLRNDPFFGVKMCGESEFNIYKILRIQEKLFIDAKIQENHLL